MGKSYIYSIAVQNVNYCKKLMHSHFQTMYWSPPPTKSYSKSQRY